eukprot:3541138-Rhodomonas_salina.2
MDVRMELRVSATHVSMLSWMLGRMSSVSSYSMASAPHAPESADASGSCHSFISHPSLSARGP